MGQLKRGKKGSRPKMSEGKKIELALFYLNFAASSLGFVYDFILP